MFNQSDKISLSITNALDINGNVIPFSLKLPIEEDFDIPSNVVKVTLFEYIDGFENEGYSVYSILRGKKQSFNSFLNSGAKYDPESFELMKCLDRVDSLDEEICYINRYNKKKHKDVRIFYSKVANQDIVVSDLNEMKEVIVKISDEFLNIVNSIDNIKTMSLKK